MAMTYEETNALTKDQVFRGRVSVACVHFAVYITDEPTDTPAHSTRYKWARTTMIASESSVNMVINTVVNDVAVQDAPGAAITDAALQGAVENAVNKLL
jgi:hypothetical protein